MGSLEQDPVAPVIFGVTGIAFVAIIGWSLARRLGQPAGVRNRGVRVGEGRRPCGRHPGPSHLALGEGLARLEARRRPARVRRSPSACRRTTRSPGDRLQNG